MFPVMLHAQIAQKANILWSSALLPTCVNSVQSTHARNPELASVMVVSVMSDFHFSTGKHAQNALLLPTEKRLETPHV
jgi:hypothetical protein